MKKMQSTKLAVAKRMPPLYHTIPGRQFNIKDSEAVRWLISQPEILQYIFDKISHEYLCYDGSTKKWKGQDYD